MIKEGRNPVRIFHQWFDVNAEIEVVEGFSAHADQDELLHWYESLGGVRHQTFLVHGEEEASESLARDIRKRATDLVVVPDLNESFPLG